MEIVAVALAVLFIVLVALFLFFAAIKIVNQYERLLVFTLGRTSPNEVKGPGWVFVVPIVQRGIRVDLREQFIEVPSQTSITKDNAPDQHRLPDLLADRRAVQERGRGPELQRRAPEHRHDDAPRGHRRHPPRRRAVEARADQRGPPRQARRGDRALGRQGHDRRDPRDHAAARRPGCDEPAALGRADATRGHHRVRGQPPVCDQRRRGRPSRPRSFGPRATGRRPSFAPKGSGLAIERIFQSASQVDQKTMALQYLEAFKAIGAEPVDQVRPAPRVHAARRRVPGLSAGIERARTKRVRRKPSGARCLWYASDRSSGHELG